MSENNEDYIEKPKNKGGRPKGSALELKRADFDRIRGDLADRIDILDRACRLANGYNVTVDQHGNTVESRCSEKTQTMFLAKIFDKTLPDLKAMDVTGDVDNNVSGEIKVTVQKLTK